MTARNSASQAPLDSEQEVVQMDKPATTETIEELEAFAAEHGLPALLDHIGLDGLGNEASRYIAALRRIADPRRAWAEDRPLREVQEIAREALGE